MPPPHPKAPYGYCWSGGSFKEHPQEGVILKLILARRSSGWSFAAITDELNENKIRTRAGGRWDAQAVSRILRTHRVQLPIVFKPSESVYYYLSGKEPEVISRIVNRAVEKYYEEEFRRERNCKTPSV